MLIRISKLFFLLLLVPVVLFIAGSPFFYGLHLAQITHKTCPARCCTASGSSVRVYHGLNVKSVLPWMQNKKPACSENHSESSENHDQKSCPVCTAFIKITKNVMVCKIFVFNILVEDSGYVHTPYVEYLPLQQTFNFASRAPPS